MPDAFTPDQHSFIRGLLRSLPSRGPQDLGFDAYTVDKAARRSERAGRAACQRALDNIEASLGYPCPPLMSAFAARRDAFGSFGGGEG